VPIVAVHAGLATAVLASEAATDVAAEETPTALHEFNGAPSSMAELTRLAGFGFSFTEKATRMCRELDANAATAHNDLAALPGPSQQIDGVVTRLVGLEDAVAAANTTFDLMQLKQQVRTKLAVSLRTSLCYFDRRLLARAGPRQPGAPVECAGN
jgi:hypothetical protein